MDKVSKSLFRDLLARINIPFIPSIHSSNNSSIINCRLKELFNNKIFKTIKVNLAHKGLHSSIILKWYLVDPYHMGSLSMDSQDFLTNLDNHQGILLCQLEWQVNMELNNNSSSSHRCYPKVATMIHWILDPWIWRQTIFMESLKIAILKERFQITFNFIRKAILSKQIKTMFKELAILSKLRCNLHTLITTVINESST